MNLFCCLLLLVLIPTPTAQRKSTEDFREFCDRFFSDSTFQLTRVKFPLEWLSVKDVSVPVDTVLLRQEQWHYSDYGYLANKYNVQIYDNFKRRLRSSPERVVSFESAGNGTSLSLYFQRIEGKWYLVKRENLGN